MASLLDVLIRLAGVQSILVFVGRPQFCFHLRGFKVEVKGIFFQAELAFCDDALGHDIGFGLVESLLEVVDPLFHQKAFFFCALLLSLVKDAVLQQALVCADHSFAEQEQTDLIKLKST